MTEHKQRRPSYAELLRRPEWQRKRLEIMKRDGWACRRCGDEKSTFNVHHRRYFKGRAPWEYDGDDLVTLCEFCHEVQNCDRSSIDELMTIWPVREYAPMDEIVCFIAGYMFEASFDDEKVRNKLREFVGTIANGSESFMAGATGAKELFDHRMARAKR